MLSAKGAAFNQAPGVVEIQTSALKARFSIFFGQPNVNRAFSTSLTRVISWGDALRLKLNGAFGVKRVGAIPTRLRTARAFAPDQAARAQRLEHRCPRIAVRGRGRPDGSPRSMRFRSRESEIASAIAMS